MEKWETKYKAGDHSTDLHFVATPTEIIIALRNLSKKALRAGGKVIRKKLKDNPDISENMRHHILTSANIERASGQPTLKVGFYGWKKVQDKGKIPSKRNPWWQEMGVKPHQITRKGSGKVLGSNGYFFPHTVQNPGFSALHTLRNTVYDNIDEIRKAQEPYLAELNKEIDAALEKEDFTEEIDDD